ncbi:alkene reductase [Streptomyces acidiscabies]|uniref:alkene reductase n=1 Tax=Streptomyces acidiscabies TaxID=42234 RepID=UPI00073E1865|nr:alkene reductase [Streptomyces acidiscabies]GAQ56318.1 N-ethylmaleimide reductase [Streptomyces acidiscabies]
MASTTPLLTPTHLGKRPLPHRLAMAPLTRNRAEPDGVPSAMMAEYYTQRASAGLIIAEATTPNATGQTYPNIPGIHTDPQIEGWRRVTDAVRAAGGTIFLQLQHGGRVGHPDTSGYVPVAPSPIPLPEPVHTPTGRQPSLIPRELTKDGIRETVADFARAARNALTAGFSGVEVHSANGHLLHQFLAANTNTRTDEYGGPAANRVRFTVEVTRAVAEAIGAENVGLRISPGNTVNGIAETDTDTLYPALVETLSGDGLAYLHLTTMNHDHPLLPRLRALWPGTLIGNPALGATVPADGGQRAAEQLLAAGADLVALGRAFLANPDLVARIRQSAPLNEVRDALMMYTGGETGYLDYPTLVQASDDRYAAVRSGS